MPTRKITRRKFLHSSAQALVGTLLLSSCSQVSQTKANKTLRFTGKIKGEKHSFGHQLRDQSITIPSIHPEKHIYDVIIVGGGMSGLVVAQQLQKHGIDDYLILEKEDKMGGLCRGEEEDGTQYACGAHYSDYPEPQMAAVNEIYETCDVITGYDKSGWPIVDDKFLLKENVHQIHTENGWEPYDYPYSLANDDDIEEFERFEDEMLTLSLWRDKYGKKAVGLPLSEISDENEIKDLDNISMSSFLKTKGYKSELLFWYCNIWIIDEYGTLLKNTSAWAALQFFKHKIAPTGKKTYTVTFPKGLGYISDKLTKMLPKEKLKNNHWAVNITEKETNIEVITWDEITNQFKKLRCKKVVFALPKQQVYHIIPTLRSAGRNEFKGLKYSPWLIANIHLTDYPNYNGDRIKWDNTIFDSWTMGYVNNQHHHNGSSKNKVITLYACFPDLEKGERSQLLQSGWEYWAKTILIELEKAHPTIESLISKMDFWIWGHPMRQPIVGSVWGEQRKQMQKPFGNIHFSHVDVSGLPVVEEAIDHAWKLAKLISNELKSN